jgi:hypothetical protein
MGAAANRRKLERDINRLFNAKNITATSNRLKRKFLRRGDFLDISKELGLLDKLDGGNFPRYRERLPIPLLIQQILTIAYREALFHKPKPIPMHISIRPSRKNSVDVKTTRNLISIVLTRPEPS